MFFITLFLDPKNLTNYCFIQKNNKYINSSHQPTYCITMKQIKLFIATISVLLLNANHVFACTGITLTAGDSSVVVARTTEWGASATHNYYVVSPRGQHYTSYTPTGENGLSFRAQYGYVAIATETARFAVEGINERGLSAGLFFFPNYGKYTAYNPANNHRTLCDMQFVSWVLSSFATIDQLTSAIDSIDLVAIHPDMGTVHWRISEPSGRIIVVECIDGKVHIYENPLGVLTNAPDFEWHMTNLNNYVNLYPGETASMRLNDSVTLRAFGAGAGMLGIPGDVTPPSRFIRAAIYQSTAPTPSSAEDAVLSCFHILNNFDIPIGIEHADRQVPDSLPSATQWTSASDLHNLLFYYRTAWNSTIRCIDLRTIPFDKTTFQSYPLDATKRQPIEMIRIKPNPRR